MTNFKDVYKSSKLTKLYKSLLKDWSIPIIGLIEYCDKKYKPRKSGDHNLVIAMEEYSECIKNISKVYRADSCPPNTDLYLDILEELADAEIAKICIMQILGIRKDELDLATAIKLENSLSILDNSTLLDNIKKRVNEN